MVAGRIGICLLALKGVERFLEFVETVGLQLRHGVRRLPILKQRKFVGIISQSDVLSWMLRVSYEPHISPEVTEILEHPGQTRN